MDDVVKDLTGIESESEVIQDFTECKEIDKHKGRKEKLKSLMKRRGITPRVRDEIMSHFNEALDLIG